jgi:tetratricopeptide (TPR) repeat protein
VGDDEAEVAARVRASGVAAAVVAALDDWATVTREPGERAWILGVARRAAPDLWGNRFRDPAVWRDRLALQELADEALRDDGAKLGELSPQLLASLGVLLLDSGGKPLPLLRVAQARHLSDFWLNVQLAFALYGAKNWEEALTYCQVAVALRPDSPLAHNNVGSALAGRSRWKEAEAAYREAIRLGPDFPMPHYGLGGALNEQGRYKEGEAACRVAIRLWPDAPLAHSNLGSALAGQGRWQEAEEACREAIHLDPNLAPAHYNLGQILSHNKKNLDEAIVEYNTTIEIDPERAQAHGALGWALMQQGRFAKARVELVRCLELLPERHPLRQYTSQLLQQCDRLAAADEKLSAVLSGQAEPDDAAEQLALAHLCVQNRHRPAAAARFYADAFAADPRLAADLRQPHRYNAACSAALAAVGQGEDAKALPDRVRLMLRRQVLRWLRDDLALYAQLAGRPDPAAKETVRQTLTHWRQDSDLASVRDPAALAQLPDDERGAWRSLWDDVNALLARAGTPPP